MTLAEGLAIDGKYMKPLESKPSRKEFIEITRSAVFLSLAKKSEDLPRVKSEETEKPTEPASKEQKTENKNDSERRSVIPSQAAGKSRRPLNESLKKSTEVFGKNPRVRLPPLSMHLPDPVKPTRKRLQGSLDQKASRMAANVGKSLPMFEEQVVVPRVVKYNELNEPIGRRKPKSDLKKMNPKENK